MTVGSPYSRHLIGGDGNTDAGAAQNHTFFIFAACDGFRHLNRNIRIVGRFGALHSKILKIHSLLTQMLHQRLLQRKPAVITPQCYCQARSPPLHIRLLFAILPVFSCHRQNFPQGRFDQMLQFFGAHLVFRK